MTITLAKDRVVIIERRASFTKDVGTKCNPESEVENRLLGSSGEAGIGDDGMLPAGMAILVPPLALHEGSSDIGVGESERPYNEVTFSAHLGVNSIVEVAPIRGEEAKATDIRSIGPNSGVRDAVDMKRGRGTREPTVKKMRRGEQSKIGNLYRFGRKYKIRCEIT